MEIILTLTGLTCAACQKLIQKRILKIEGVNDVVVELSGQTSIKASRKITSGEVADVLKDTKYAVKTS